MRIGVNECPRRRTTSKKQGEGNDERRQLKLYDVATAQATSSN